MSPGDASSQKAMTNKAWDREMDAYKQARADGIQPAGTSMAKIREARRASEVLGKSYDSNSMPNSQLIQNNTVSKLKEVGLV